MTDFEKAISEIPQDWRLKLWQSAFPKDGPDWWGCSLFRLEKPDGSWVPPYACVTVLNKRTAAEAIRAAITQAAALDEKTHD